MFDQRLIRNFSIIAHVDHGKTTLTDRFLQLTNSLQARETQDRIMDSNPIEKERGITIKLAPVRMNYQPKVKDQPQPQLQPLPQPQPQPQSYVLNLIDTPGHVDFSYEVSRSLAACEGALLLVDATQGIQAQTLSHYEQAKQLGLTVIPVLNKIDLASAQPEQVMLEVMELVDCQESDILLASAKTGQGADLILETIIEKVPPPAGQPNKPSRALLITSHYDQHKGAVALVRVVDGELGREKLQFLASGDQFLPVEVGVFTPGMKTVESLGVGEVGYIATGLKDVRALKIGDTITKVADAKQAQPLTGYREPQPMVFMEVYPLEGDDFPLLQAAVEKLVLRDAALTFQGTHSPALGSGLQMGFLGILHAEVVLERLKREFELSVLATTPSVSYQADLIAEQEKIIIQTPAQMPDPSQIKTLYEPWTKLTIFVPATYFGEVMNFCRERRGKLLASTPVGERLRLEFDLPLSELITDFHDTIKSLTSGYASVEYKVADYRPVDAVKVSILINKEPVEALSFITVREQAENQGRQRVKKLAEAIPRQLFTIPIQAAIGANIIARETIRPYRKDVTAKLYGGDVTRRKKLLAKQAKGKKRLKQFGKVELDQKVFLSVLRQDSRG